MSSSASRYRPDRWRTAEILTLAAGVAAAVAFSMTDPTLLHPTVVPLTWPQVPPGALLGLGLALLPAFLTPPPQPVSTPPHRAPVLV
jgi:energy-coupling factor transport system permease protein